MVVVVVVLVVRTMEQRACLCRHARMHAMNHANCCLAARRNTSSLMSTNPLDSQHLLAIEGSHPSLSFRHTLTRGKLNRPEPPGADARAENAFNQAET